MRLPEDITCPSCGVLAGHPCLGRDGTPRRFHASRLLGRERDHNKKKPNQQPEGNL